MHSTTAEMLRSEGREASKAGAALAEEAEVETLYYVQGGAAAWKARSKYCRAPCKHTKTTTIVPRTCPAVATTHEICTRAGKPVCASAHAAGNTCSRTISTGTVMSFMRRRRLHIIKSMDG